MKFLSKNEVSLISGGIDCYCLSAVAVVLDIGHFQFSVGAMDVNTLPKGVMCIHFTEENEKRAAMKGLTIAQACDEVCVKQFNYASGVLELPEGMTYRRTSDTKYM